MGPIRKNATRRGNYKAGPCLSGGNVGLWPRLQFGEAGLLRVLGLKGQGLSRRRLRLRGRSRVNRYRTTLKSGLLEIELPLLQRGRIVALQGLVRCRLQARKHHMHGYALTYIRVGSATGACGAADSVVPAVLNVKEISGSMRLTESA